MKKIQIGRRTFLKIGQALTVAGLTPSVLSSAYAQTKADIATSPIASTTLGRIRGSMSNGVAVFRGVRYAQPPVGIRRFAKPEPLARWTGIQDALENGSISLQPPSVGALQPFESPKISDEDCLSLTVWTPRPDTAKRPVMVWLHGGGLISGAGSLPVYSGERLARDGDIVVVNVNYRLGALGYLKIAGVTPGNLGLHDQLAALKWVKDHIASFGGDPNTVTIAGQSGGAYSIGLMLAGNPDGYGLFHRAIIESPPTGAPPALPEHSNKVAEIFLAEFGLTLSSPNKLEILRAATSEQILAAQVATTQKFARFGNTPAFLPTADDELVPVAMGTAAYSDVVKPNMPVIIGTGRDEAYTTASNTPALVQADDAAVNNAFSRIYKDPEKAIAAYKKYRPGASRRDLILDVAGDAQYKWQALRFAEQQASRQYAVYAYQFDWAPAATRFGPGHYLEVPFVFGTTAGVSRGATVPMWEGGNLDKMENLSTAVRSAWIAFIRTGRPDHSATAPWPAYTAKDRSTMTFNEVSTSAGDPAGYAWRSPAALR